MNYQSLDKFVMPKNFRGRGVIAVQLWWVIQSSLFARSPQFAYKWRNFLLRMFGAKIGEGVIIRPNVRITYPWKLTVGDHAWVGDNAELYTLGEITIGKNAVVSQKSYLCTGSHDFQSEAFEIYQKPIIIEDEAWVAADVYIAPGDKHLEVVHKNGVLFCTLSDGPEVNRHKPAVDVLFDSLNGIADNVQAVLLTGMGQDGAHGMLRLKELGARTIIQDKSSSLIWGMPGRAHAISAHTAQIPLMSISKAILQYASLKRIEMQDVLEQSDIEGAL